MTRRRLHRRLVAIALAVAGALLVAACASPQVHRPAPGQTISVRGRWLMRGGAAFVPRGVQIVGLVAPYQALTGPYLQARRHFGIAELRAAVADHVNTIRFQVSQFGLDPGNPLYSSAYFHAVVKAVHLARRLGLAVIVSVQAEAPAGAVRRCPLPDAGTLSVWEELAARFRGDRGVMLELYNEPGVAATSLGWAQWKSGGMVYNPPGFCMAVGMQRLIDAIRARGARNVIIVPGLDMQRTISGMPSLTDPSSPGDPQLAYSVHYPPLTAGAPAWEHEFGAASNRVPVIVTEWDADSINSCAAAAPIAAPVFLYYLSSRHIGVVGFAFDVPGSIIRNWSYAPTTYRGFRCGVPGGGPGRLLFHRFAAQAAKKPG